jgi:hypothetical protein
MPKVGKDQIRSTTTPYYRLYRDPTGLWSLFRHNGVHLGSYRSLDVAMEHAKALLAVHPAYKLERVWGVSPNEFILMCQEWKRENSMPPLFPREEVKVLQPAADRIEVKSNAGD